MSQCGLCPLPSRSNVLYLSSIILETYDHWHCRGTGRAVQSAKNNE